MDLRDASASKNKIHRRMKQQTTNGATKAARGKPKATKGTTK